MSEVSRPHPEPQAQYTADGNSILAEGADGLLWHYVLDGGTKDGSLGTKPYRNFSVSGLGDHLAGVVDGEIWVLDLVTMLERNTGLNAEAIIDWHPSGSSLFFLAEEGLGEYSIESGSVTWHLEKKDPPSNLAEQLYFLWPNPNGDVSADGTQLVLTAGHPAMATVYRLDLRGGDLYRYGETEGDAMSAHWHPDQQHVLYAGGRMALRVSDEEITKFELPVVGWYVEDVTPDGQMLLRMWQDGLVCRYSGPVPSIDDQGEE